MKFSDWKVGTRLAVGFAVMVALLMGLGSLSVLAMNKTKEETVTLLEQTLQTERMLKDWHAVIEVNLVRSLAAAKASDPAVQKQFEDAIAQGSAGASALQKAIGERLPDGEARKLFEEVNQRRAAYREARAAAFKEKNAGNLELANRFFDNEMRQQAQDYLASLDKLVRFQQQLINHTGEEIELLSERTAETVAGASLLAILAAAGMGYAIARSLLRQLGGEPVYAAEVTARIAAGDLSQPVAIRAGDRSSLLFSISQMRDSLAGIVGEVRSGTDRVLHSSREIASGVSDLSGRTEKQASSLEETASSMEELTGTVRQNEDSARQANQLVQGAAQVAAQGGDVVAQVVHTMDGLEEAARKMSDIIGVIDGIAFQTNILALNAAVEAARAGEQGRGFAVVASEVRNLAQRSASAAKEIKVLIESSVSQVAEGNALAARAGETMSRVVTSVKQVSDIMLEVSTASGEQAAGAEQINEAVVQMDAVTQQNAALVEQAAAATQSLEQEALRLSEAVSRFRLADERRPASVAVLHPQAPRVVRTLQRAAA